MKTINCDHCGEEIEAPSSNNHKITTEYVGMHGYVEEQYDMCAGCFNKINQKILRSLYHAKTNRP